MWLICTDLDRTLLPNGGAPVSPFAYELVHSIATLPEVMLVFVSGRDRVLVEQAIREYDLPIPNYVIGDVGSSLYRVSKIDKTEENSFLQNVELRWECDEGWSEKIMNDWHGMQGDNILQLLSSLDGLRPQEASKQAECKASFYIDHLDAAEQIQAEVEDTLETAGVLSNIIYSVDETTDLGLLDILPLSAGKLPSIQYLMQVLSIEKTQIVFSGDSGNDLDVLCSDLPSTLVKNADRTIKLHATELCKKRGFSNTLYVAKGLNEKLNGHYAAGIVEGLLHYWPWLYQSIGIESYE